MKKSVLLEIFYIYFSPYTAHAIELDGIVYPTIEHAYQCQRYIDKKIIDEIRSAPSPVKALGNVDEIQASTKSHNSRIAAISEKS